MEKPLSGAVIPLCHMAKWGNCHHLNGELSSCELLGNMNMSFESGFSVAPGGVNNKTSVGSEKRVILFVSLPIHKGYPEMTG